MLGGGGRERRRRRHDAIATAALALTLLIALCLSVSPARAGEVEDFYDPARVVIVDLTIPPESWRSLELEPRTWAPATLTLDLAGDQIGPLDVTVKLKGHDTFRPIGQKSALRIKFAKDQRLYGLKSLTLNNMVSDPSLTHEALGYDLFRAAGVPAPLAGYAYVRINGAGYGLYLNLEHYDDVSLKRIFAGAKSRHLYEPADYFVDVEPGRARDFEIDEGDEEDVSDLEALIAAVDDPDSDLSQVADLDEMTRMWAVEQFIGHWDGYSVSGRPWQVNYFLRSDKNGRFSMLPWGIDQAFWVAFPLFSGGGLLTLRCRADSACQAKLDAALAQTLSTAGAIQIGRRLDALAATISPWLGCPSAAPVTESEWAGAVLGVRYFIAARRLDVADYLGTTVQPVPELESDVPPPTGGPCPVSAGQPPNQTPGPQPDPGDDPSPVDLDGPGTGQAPEEPPGPKPAPKPVPAKNPPAARVSARTTAGGPLQIQIDLGTATGGTVRCTYVAAGRTRRFTVRFVRGKARARIPLSGGQARLASGLLRFSFAGDKRIRPLYGEIRASRHAANLRASSARIRGERLELAGTISARVRGHVQVKALYEHAGRTRAIVFRAPARSGRWRLTRRLPSAAHQGAALVIGYPGDTDVAGQIVTRNVTAPGR